MTSKTYTTLKELKEILEAVPGVTFVSNGKPKNVEIEDRLTAVYMLAPIENFEQYKPGSNKASYTGSLFVKLVVNTICDKGDDLEWVFVRDNIINAVLDDSAIWSTILDRDLISAVGDDYDNYPRKTLEIAFEFKSRDVC